MPILDTGAIQSALTELRGWSYEDNALRKTLRFSTFTDGIAFVIRIADLAEELGHHPDIDIRYSTIMLTLSTHSEGGVTALDLTLARRIDALLAN